MKLLAKSTVINSLALLTMIGVAVAQAQPIPVTECGQVLSQPGDYVLTGALDNQECPTYKCSSAGSAITITASNVHFDTAGHGVNAICAAAAIADGAKNIRIDGGGWLFGGSGLIIGKDSRVVVNGLADIHGDPDLGSTQTGIDIRGADHVTVNHNNIEGVFGIHGHAVDSKFVNNQIAGLGIVNHGILLTGYGNVIKNNTVTLSGASAENSAIGVTNYNWIIANTIHQAGTGINLAGDFNRVLRNIVDGDAPPSVPVASVYGIFASDGAEGNVIKRNKANGDEYDVFDQNGPPCVNFWRGNQFQTSGGAVACIH